MERETTHARASATVVWGLFLGLAVTALDGSAQSPPADQGRWRIGASSGGYVAPSALIRAADSNNTRLEAAPSFSLESEYLFSEPLSVYVNGIVAFGALQLGSTFQPALVGLSSQVTLGVGTAGVVLSATDWLGGWLQPTLRVGGGLKWYRFDLTGAENQVRPTADIGLGFRGVGAGAIDGTAEIRYLLSSFDQGKLPTRGISPQDQRQNDLMFSVGLRVRP